MLRTDEKNIFTFISASFKPSVYIWLSPYIAQLRVQFIGAQPFKVNLSNKVTMASIKAILSTILQENERNKNNLSTGAMDIRY